jgi:hypothetical protein
MDVANSNNPNTFDSIDKTLHSIVEFFKRVHASPRNGAGEENI